MTAAKYNIGWTIEEVAEMLLLIDEEPVDEEILQGIRRKLIHKQKLLRQREKRDRPA